MGTGTKMTYGAYSFSPVPILSINAEPIRMDNQTGLGNQYTVEFEGEIIVPLESGVSGLYDEIDRFNQALLQDGHLLVVTCDDNVFISGYPIIDNRSISAASDNFVHRAKYTVSFRMPTLKHGSGYDPYNYSDSGSVPPFIKSVSDSWDIQFADDRVPVKFNNEIFGYKLVATHTVNVAARPVYTGDTALHDMFDDALKYTSGLLGFDNKSVNLSGLLNLPGQPLFDQYTAFQQYRQITVNKTDQTIQAVETFIVSPSGANVNPNNAIETFDFNISQGEGIITVGIQGKIDGLTSITPVDNSGLDFGSGKFAAASGYFEYIRPKIYSRVSEIYSGIALKDSPTCTITTPLNPIPKTRSIGVNVIDGSITYNYEFDNSFAGCLTGNCIISRNISIDDQLATDVVAEQVVLGRAFGPILQDIGTVTARVRTLNIELVTTPPSSCLTVDELYKPIPTGGIQDLINTVSGGILAEYGSGIQMFVVTNNQNWNFTVGRYTRSIGWKYVPCTG